MKKACWIAASLLTVGAVGAVVFLTFSTQKQLRGSQQAGDIAATGRTTSIPPSAEVGSTPSPAEASDEGKVPNTSPSTSVTSTTQSTTATETTATSTTTSSSTTSSSTTSSSTTTLQPEVRILHISDTHTLHKDLENLYGLPPADILIHTGDFTNHGTDAEIGDFNDWLGKVKAKYGYKHILLITGNHDWYEVLNQVGSGRMSAKAALDPAYFKSKVTNAMVLDHEMVEVMGIKIFGSTWCPWHPDNKPAVEANGASFHQIFSEWSTMGGRQHRFDEIPEGIDVLMTHGPASGILDAGGWGSSDELLTAIKRVQPKVHMFGHVHEQRGYWLKSEGSNTWQGGVQYEVKRGSGNFFPTRGPPPPTYPVEIVSNTAVMSNGGLEGGWWHIAGPGRLLTFKQQEDLSWKATMP